MPQQGKVNGVTKIAKVCEPASKSTTGTANKPSGRGQDAGFWLLLLLLLQVLIRLLLRRTLGDRDLVAAVRCGDLVLWHLRQLSD